MDQIKLLFVSPPGHVGGEGEVAKRIVTHVHSGYKVTTRVSDGKPAKAKTKYVRGR